MIVLFFVNTTFSPKLNIHKVIASLDRVSAGAGAGAVVMM